MWGWFWELRWDILRGVAVIGAYRYGFVLLA